MLVYMSIYCFQVLAIKELERDLYLVFTVTHILIIISKFLITNIWIYSINYTLQIQVNCLFT